MLMTPRKKHVVGMKTGDEAVLCGEKESIDLFELVLAQGT